MEQLKSRVRQKQRLPVGVFSTPAADAVLARSGLSIVDLLRPVSLVNNLNVPMRVGEYSMRVQEVQLALYAGNAMFQPAPELIDERLQQVLDLESQRHAQLQPAGNVIQHVQREAPESINPWFFGYSTEFLRLLQFTDHEALDHPVAGMLCMPADTTSPLQVAEKLLQPEQALPLVASESMAPLTDPVVGKHFLLVQDATSMNDGRALQNLATLSNTYGAANCSLLKLYGDSTAGGSGGGGGAAALPPAAFQACREACVPKGGGGEPASRPQEPPGGLGAGLNPDDLAAAGQVLRDFTERTLLPKLEERIARLNLSITAARKGLKNRLTRLWKGAAGETGPTQDAPYPWHSVEGQMRCLADLAFMLGQIEFAVAMYRLAAQDYLAAPNSKWYAGAEEMIGMCSILTQDPSVDPVKYLNRAFEHYSKLRGRQGRMLATRVMMTAAAYQAALGRHLSANNSFMRAHFDEESARAALLLEAAAYELMRCVPPCARKAAFHLVLAGLRYHSARQKRLAVHCYLQVTELYHNSSWQHINEHLHEVLGRQCAELADATGMLRHHTALLDCAHRPAAAQAHYLNQFLDTIKTAGVTGAIPHLPLPAVVNDTVAVHHADMRCYTSTAAAAAAAGKPPASVSSTGSSDAAAASPAAVWGRLEQLVAGGDMPSTNWLEGAKQVHDGEEFNTVAAGEDTGVRVTFRNPLQIKLGLSRVRLHVQFTPADKASAAPAAAGADPSAAAAAAAAAAAGPVSPADVLVMESQFSLHPGEVLSEQLTVRPLAAGWLRVLGVSWVLAGAAEGYLEFDIKGRRRKRPKGDRPSQQKHYPPSRRLLFHVLKGMPRLELSIAGLPTTAAAGELLRVQATVRNVGLLAACNLKAAISSPQVALGAAAAPGGGAAAGCGTDVWSALQAANDVMTLAKQRAMHRRHQSSGAALIGTSRDRQQAAAAAAPPKGTAAATSSAAAAAAHLEHSSGPQHDHLPHIHSSPSIPAVAAAAAAAAGGVGGSRDGRSTAAVGQHNGAAASDGVGWQGGQGSAAAEAAAAAASAAGVFNFAAPDLVLQPGQSVSVPMWIHVQQPGQFEFQCIWFCEPQVLVSAAMRYRVLLSHHLLAVYPLLELSPGASPSAADLSSYTLKLEATYSKEAPRGQLQLQQISCLTAGLDGGWRLTPFTCSSASSTSATPAAAALQQSLAPSIALSAGECSMHYLQLLSPAAAAAAVASSSSSSSSSSSTAPSSQFVPLQQGPLHFFYSRCKQGLLLQQQSQQVLASGSSPSTPTAAAAADSSSVAAGLRGVAFEYKQPALVAEPPIDLLVLWRHLPTAATPTGAPAPQQQQQRVGMLTFYDLCAAQRFNPVRMTLEGPAGLNPSGQQPGQQGLGRSSIRHDFRSASMCVVPLKLKLRNCGVVAVSVTVRASHVWQGLSSDHAWFCSPSTPGARHPGLLSSSGPHPHGSPAAAAAAAGPPATSSGLGGPTSTQGTMQQLSRFPGGPGLPETAGGRQQQQQQQPLQQPYGVAGPAAAGYAAAGTTAGPPPPAPPSAAADGSLPPKLRTTPPTSTGGSVSVLGPAAAAAEGLGLGGFNLGALAGGLTAGLRLPAPGGAAGSDDAGSAGSSVHGGAAAPAPPQHLAPTPAAGSTAGLGAFPGVAAGGVTHIPATATAIPSTVAARGGGVSPRPGPPAGFGGSQDTTGPQQQQQQQPQPQPQQQEVQAGLPPGPDHVWCGVTRVTLEALQPGSTAEVHLQVAVFRPGVYVVDGYVVDWQVVGGAPGTRRRAGSKMGEPAVLKVDST